MIYMYIENKSKLDWNVKKKIYKKYFMHYKEGTKTGQR